MSNEPAIELKDELIVKTLTDFFNEVQKEYLTLKEQEHYDRDKLQGYNDCLWDMKVILKDNHNIEVKYVKP